MAKELTYKINEIPLSRFGIEVSNADGVLDYLAIKEPDIIDYPGEHGHDADLSARRYEARTITLSCGLAAPSALDMERQISAFHKLLGLGLVRLEIDVYRQSVMVFDVYVDRGFKIKKRWREGKNIATFQLILIEPQPIKRVYSTRARTAAFEFESEKNISISWGDGTVEKYLSQGKEHVYTDDIDKHYIIISGDIENLEITTNHQLECSV
jgi:hypothetical protein